MKKILSAALINFIVCLFSVSAFAATKTWNGGGANDNWNTGANWDAALVAGDQPHFAGSTRLTPSNNFVADTSFSGLTFDSGAGAFTLSGNRITLGGNVVNNSSSLETINFDMIMSGDRIFQLNNGNLTVNGVISETGGARSLTMQGSKILTLGGANTYTGQTIIQNGTLSVGSIGSIGSASSNLGAPTTVANGTIAFGGAATIGALRYTGAGETTDRVIDLAGPSGGGASIDQSGAGLLKFTSDFTATGTGAKRISLQGSTAGTGEISGVIADISGATTSVSKFGSGTWTLSGANTYTGQTTVNAGELDLNCATANSISGNLSISGGLVKLLRADQISDTKTVTVSSGTFDIQGFDDTVAGVRLTNGNINGTTGVLTSTTDFNMQSGSASAILSGAVGLTKTTAGTVTLSGANTYTGLTDVQAGTLAYGADNVISDSSSVRVSGAILDIGTFNDTVAGVQLSGASINGSGGTLTSLSNFDLQSGSVSAILGGAVGLDKTTAGTVTLSGANTYSGATTVGAGGTLWLGAAGVIPDSSALTLNGTLDMNGNTETIGSLAGASTGLVTNSTGTDVTLIAGGDNSSTTFAGVIEDGLGGGLTGLLKDGAGILTLSGANTYTGTTSVSDGELDLNTTGANSISGDLAVSGTGAAKLLQSDQIDDTRSVSVSSGAFDIQGFNDTVNGVQLTVGSINGSGGTLTSFTDFAMQSGNVSAILGGGVGLNKTTGGTVIFSGANTYTGITDIQAGVLEYGADNVSSDLSNISVSGGALDISTFNDTVNGVQLTAGSIDGTTGILTSLTDFDMRDGSVSAILDGSVRLTKTTGGTVTLLGANTYTGITDVQEGTLQLGAADVISDASALIADGTLDMNGFSETVGSLAGAGTGSVTNSAGGAVTLTAGGDNTSTLFAGVIEDGIGTTSFIKAGAGTLTFSGANTYTGLTDVQAGTLAYGANDVSSDLSNIKVSGGALDISTFNDTVNGVQLTGGSINGSSGILTSATDFELQDGSVSAILDGGVGLNKTTAGTVTLSGANTFTGATSVSDGELDLNTAGANSISGDLAVSGTGTAKLLQSGQIDDTKSVSVSSGTFDIQGFNDTVNEVQLSGGSINGSGGILTSANDFDVRDGSVSAILDGSVWLSKTTAGTVILSGANTYTGITDVQAGTLAYGADNVSSDLSNVSVSGGTFDISTFNDTVNGVQLTGGSINGAGGTLTSLTDFDMRNGSVSAILGGGVRLTKTTGGTVTLSGVNTYTGITDVQAGTLQLGTFDVIPDASAVIVDGTLDMNGSDEVIGSLAGTGLVTNSGGFDVILTAGGDNTSTTFSGVIENGSGGRTMSFTKEGSGTFSTGNDFGASGALLKAVDVTGGTFILNNNLYALSAGVGSGANMQVAGNRTINGALTLAGTGILDISNSTLTLDNSGLGSGIYTQGAGTALNLAINSASDFGKIVGAGSALVDSGSGINVAYGGGYIPSGTTFKIIDGTGGAGVDVPSTITSNSWALRFSGSTSGEDLILTSVRANGYNTVSTDPNIQNVGKALEDAGAAGATGDMLYVLNTLDSLGSAAEVEKALGTMIPVVDRGYIDASRAAMSGFVGTSLAHIEQAVLAGISEVRQLEEEMIQDRIFSGISSGDRYPENGHALWAQGFASYLKQNDRGTILGYNATIYGTVVGFDAPIYNDNIQAGMSYGYSQGKVKSKSEGGRTLLDSYQTSVYGVYSPLPYYVDAAISFAWNTYDASRNISFGGIGRTASADYDGQQYSAYAGGGYNFTFGDLILAPVLSMTYSRLCLEGYTETGADSLDLTVGRQDYDMLQSGLGVKVEQHFRNKYGEFVPSLHFKWLYDFIGDSDQTVATFSGGGTAFRTQGNDPPRNSYNFGSRLGFITGSGTSLLLDYDSELKEDFYSHNGKFTLRQNF